MFKFSSKILFALMIFVTSGCHHGDNDKVASESNSEANQYCENPAPLYRQPEPGAPGYIVVFKDEIDGDAEVNRFIVEYEIQVGATYNTPNGFFGEMTVDTMEQLRCEDSVSYIEHNALVSNN
ncbi:MAG TPA: hypothetical protein ENJ07_04625 [Gammaproteobacteria bacterium]|nr:hypothetical protein [Gammaproteobacteria bacterium]